MLLQDVAYAMRTLRKSPGFTVAAVLTISLGVGVTTAIFTVADAVLLRSLPYKDPDRLVFAIGEFRKRSVTDWPFSNANFLDLRRGARTTFEDLGGVFTFRSMLRKEDGTLEKVRTAVVRPNFFLLLGARLAVGRDFLESDGQPQTQTQTAPANDRDLELRVLVAALRGEPGDPRPPHHQWRPNCGRALAGVRAALSIWL